MFPNSLFCFYYVRQGALANGLVTVAPKIVMPLY